MEEPLLAVEKLVAGYGKLAIVQNISLRAFKNEVVAILGPNGCGKSTLIKSIVKQSTVFSGRILFRGKDVTFTPPDVLVKMGMSYVPQVNNIFESLTIRENLELGGYTIKEKKVLNKRMEEVFQLFPILEKRKKERARTLSGGERQLLAIAIGLMTKPIFMMLDEPSASVAPNMVKRIFKRISEIRDAGVTIILVEQNIHEALNIANKTVVMCSGSLIFRGEGRLSIDDEKLCAALLGMTVNTDGSMHDDA